MLGMAFGVLYGMGTDGCAQRLPAPWTVAALCARLGAALTYRHLFPDSLCRLLCASALTRFFFLHKIVYVSYFGRKHNGVRCFKPVLSGKPCISFSPLSSAAHTL